MSRGNAASFAPTDSDHALPVFPNLPAQAVLTGPDQLWVGDVTYIRLTRGFAYLAVILDAWSRRVIGYALAPHMDVRLTLAALHGAIASRRLPPDCIYHSDRGSQYAAFQYRAALERHGLRGSMSRRATPEAFMKTLKVEEVYISRTQHSPRRPRASALPR